MRRATVIVLIVAAALGIAGGGYWLGGKNARHPGADTPTQTERKVLYWFDPMYPQQKFDKPGKSPFMDMQLVPKYADEKEAEGGVTVSARTQQSLGVRTAQAELTEIRHEIAAVGSVLVDERRIVRVEVRAAGWVEKLHVRAVDDPVRAGQVLAELYSPELLTAQEEYLLARRMAQANSADAPLAQAARSRLELLGLAAEEIGRIEQSGTASRRVPLVAPIAGVLSELAVREGAMVQAGAAAFTVTDLSSVWVALEVPEAQGAALRQGMAAEVRVPTLPGRAYRGRVDYVYPELNSATRTLKARVAVANPARELKPGMFANVGLVSGARKVLTVPTEAVIQTGTRSVVVVAEGERFRAETVKVGAESGGRTEILSGLEPGTRVVASGQFLIDSEASLRGTLARLEEPKKHALHRGTGKVLGLNAAEGYLELDHDPIPSLQWPRMTMPFSVPDKAQLAPLKEGDRVEFELRPEQNKDGDFVIEKLRKQP